MNDSTKITYENVRDAVNKINADKDKIQGILDEFTRNINDSTNDAVFQGQAAEAFKGRFTELKSKFDEYIKIVEEFSSMITFAEQSTESSEKQMASLADVLAG